MVRVTCEVTTRKVTEEELSKLRERQIAVAVSLGEKHPNVQVQAPSADELQPVLLLKEVEGTRTLPIFCGQFEATAIALAQEGVETERPMTHDLLRDVVSAMGNAREVRITELRGDTFFAELAVTDTSGEERTVSCRPSDGIALAVRANIPIPRRRALARGWRERLALVVAATPDQQSRGPATSVLFGAVAGAAMGGLTWILGRRHASRAP